MYKEKKSKNVKDIFFGKFFNKTVWLYLSSTLVSHFKTLSELKSEFHNRYAQLSEQLKELEKIC
jgi:hypothetical protein